MKKKVRIECCNKYKKHKRYCKDCPKKIKKENMKLTVYYSVRNGGDGSAYPTFMESKELCEWDQDHMDEGWGESCDGSISFESESPIMCIDEIITKEYYLINNYIEAYTKRNDEMNVFISQFFPDGLPTFRVEIRDVAGQDENYEYCYNLVFIGDKQVMKIFKNKKDSVEIFEQKLNKINETTI